jgi:hypothetical protein
MRWLERYLTEGSPRLQHFAEISASLAKLDRMDVRLKPPIDPEQTRKPTPKESPEAFVFLSDPTWATRDEPCLLLVSHGDEVRRFAAPGGMDTGGQARQLEGRPAHR